jgi:hypothetical protein
MLPFALPMVLLPRLTTALASRRSGRELLTAGLAITFIGNLLFWTIARAHLPYGAFVVGMLVVGTGAGVLNGQTVKVLGSAVPPERAGMASGLASTTRFIGILISVAVMGAVISGIVHRAFGGAAMAVGFDVASAGAAAKRVTSGDLAGVLNALPPASRAFLHAAGLAAFGQGFGVASLLAAAVAIVACVLAFVLIRTEETWPAPITKKLPCKFVDCRDPL